MGAPAPPTPAPGHPGAGRSAISSQLCGVCYGMARMAKSRALLLACALLAMSTGCETARKIAGLPPGGEPSELKSAEARWLLIQNPRYGDVPSEPEYIWVEEDKVPTA